jgi:NADH-quinone oxidoreductase subunit L
LATLGGLISLPTNSWLNEYLAPLFTKVATEEHHFGTSEYMLMLVAVVDYWNRIAYSNTSNKISFLKMKNHWFCKSLYNKYYVDEFMIPFSLKSINGLSKFFRDNVETTLSSLVLD